MPATTPALAALEAKARAVRRDIITSTTEAGSGHPTSSLSAVEIAVALYFGGFLHHDPKNPHWPQRDRFILSKGHAAPLLYAVLAEAGYFPRTQLPTLRKLGNLVAIVDQNGYQQTGPTAEVLDLRPLAQRWQAFGWFAQEVNGHDLSE